MIQKHKFFIGKVRMSDKGQVTFPKKIRDECNYEKDDEFIIRHLPGGDTVFHKIDIKKPEDRMLEIIRSFPKIDWDNAWKEVKEERAKEHR